MFSPRGRGRGRSPWPWPFRLQDIRRLLLAASILLFVVLQLYFFNSTTRKYKDCSVPWLSVAEYDRQQGAKQQKHPLRIALVSMSTGGAHGGGDDAAQRLNARSAEFAGLLDITGPNKQRYADMHGYTYVDASGLLNTSRPASWSKIPAVLSVLQQYDWVLWTDADTLITNASVALEALLPAGEGPDMLLTRDATGVNAGVWLVRSCAWSAAFLQRWWDMESFVRGPGDTKSGDNDALKALMAGLGGDPALDAHVGVAPQCALNSYLWRSSGRTWLRYLRDPHGILTGLWQPGDFLLHPAGIDNKRSALLRVMRRHGLGAGAPPAGGRRGGGPAEKRREK